MLPTSFEYVALGHIHKPQCIRGMSHVRYAGSLDRMDFGEKYDDKSIVLVEIGPRGRRGEPLEIRIEPTSLLDVTLSDPLLDQEAIARLVPTASDAIIRVVISPNASIEAGDVLERAVHEAIPNGVWIDRRNPVTR